MFIHKSFNKKLRYSRIFCHLLSHISQRVGHAADPSAHSCVQCQVFVYITTCFVMIHVLSPSMSCH